MTITRSHTFLLPVSAAVIVLSGCANPDFDYSKEIHVGVGKFEIDPSFPEVVDTDGFLGKEQKRTSEIFEETIKSLLITHGLSRGNDSGCRLNGHLNKFKHLHTENLDRGRFPYRFYYALDFKIDISAKNGEKISHSFDKKFRFTSSKPFFRVFPAKVTMAEDLRKNVFPSKASIDNASVQKFLAFMKANCAP